MQKLSEEELNKILQETGTTELLWKQEVKDISKSLQKQEQLLKNKDFEKILKYINSNGLIYDELQLLVFETNNEEIVKAFVNSNKKVQISYKTLLNLINNEKFELLQICFENEPLPLNIKTKFFEKSDKECIKLYLQKYHPLVQL